MIFVYFRFVMASCVIQMNERCLDRSSVMLEVGSVIQTFCFYFILSRLCYT